MSGTSTQVLNPPSLYLNLYLNIEFTDLEASHPNSVFIRILVRHILEPPFLIFIYLFIKYYLSFITAI